MRTPGPGSARVSRSRPMHAAFCRSAQRLVRILLLPAVAMSPLGAAGALDAAGGDHPLDPYLAYEGLRAGPADDPAIETFLAGAPPPPLADALRARYLDALAAAGRWADYARIYRDDGSTERQCLFARALIETGRAGEALDPAAMAPLWLVAKSQPKACDPLFAAWRAAGGLTPSLVWQRLRLAMEAGRPGLGRYLAKLLPEDERALAARWLALVAQPAGVSDPALIAERHPMVAAILGDGIVRLASADARAAAGAIDAARERLAADPDAWDRAHSTVGIALAEDGAAGDHALGLALWDRMSERPENLDAQERRLRAGVRRGAWERVVAWVDRLPASTAKGDRWLYWQARAQEALGDPRAPETYRRAAEHRSLWGFLAADRMGLPYRMSHRAVPAEPERIRAIVTTPAYVRIRALRRLGREAEMRREWRALTRDLPPEDLMAAAWVADVLGWHDQAIFTLARTGYWDDLALRFPLAYRSLVVEQAWQTALPEPWIFAVLRQESVFAPTVASPAGALGLMQLMPATARAVARDSELLPSSAGLSRWEILNPATNIALGSGYLAQMRDRFGHPALATAAYNAGPHRVERWLPARCMPADLWIISIPFRETRGYVERVLTYRMIYRRRLALAPVRISDLLPDIPGRDWWRQAGS